MTTTMTPTVKTSSPLLPRSLSRRRCCSSSQSAFLDIFSDIDLQMLLVAHMYNTNTEDCFLRAMARLMGAAKLFRVQAELPHPNDMRAHIHHVQVSSEGDTVQVLGVDDAFTRELAVAVKELWR